MLQFLASAEDTLFARQVGLQGWRNKSQTHDITLCHTMTLLKLAKV